MAESGEEAMAASWWGGWLQTAKEKSMAALDMVRKDLTEFGTTMQSDAGHVVEFTSSTLKDSLKTENTSAAKDKLTKGLNTVLERLSQALVVPPDDEGQIPITASSAELYDRTKARIHAIQLDAGTYLNEPSGARETYGMWCEGFDLEDRKGEISELLVSKAEVRALYTKLVPSRVSHVDFWRHYFYKLHQMEVEQARKEALMKRADSAGAEDSISWDDDWSGDEAAAEDSGSDWEKLPRPGHHRHSPSPSLSPPPSPVTVPALSLGEQTKDSQTMGDVSQVEGVAGPGRVGQGSEEDQREEQTEERLQVSQAPGPQQDGSCPVVTPSPVETPGPEVGSCGEEDVAGSPLAQKSTDSFKDYLQLAADDGEKAAEMASVELEREDVPSSPPGLNETEPQSDSEKHQEIDPQLPSLSPTPVVEDVTSSPEILPDPSLLAEAQVGQVSAPQSDDDLQSSSTAEEEKAEEEETGGVKEVLSVTVDEEGASLKTTEKGDLVVVGSDHGSPVSNISGSKGLSDVDEEWEQDLDIELTEEDMKEAEDLARKLGDNIDLEEEDWESWE